MKKPQKKKEFTTIDTRYNQKVTLPLSAGEIGYNLACDDWEKWLRSK